MLSTFSLHLHSFSLCQSFYSQFPFFFPFRSSHWFCQYHGRPRGTVPPGCPPQSPAARAALPVAAQRWSGPTAPEPHVRGSPWPSPLRHSWPAPRVLAPALCTCRSTGYGWAYWDPVCMMRNKRKLEREREKRKDRE